MEEAQIDSPAVDSESAEEAGGRRGEHVACIVPAYNEAPRIEAVLRRLIDAIEHEHFHELIVVDDGSFDGTRYVVEELFSALPPEMRARTRLIQLGQNRGKGAALKTGFAATQADIYLTIDSDLLGLSHTHIETLLDALRSDPEIAMVTGIAIGDDIRVSLAQRLFPALNGQRAIRRWFIEALPDLSESRWGVETLMERAASRSSARTARITLPGLTQVMKEQKYGFFRGAGYRLMMYGDILGEMIRTRRV